MEAGLVGSLLRMYVQTKPFVPIMKRCEDLRIVPDVYEFEEIFDKKGFIFAKIENDDIGLCKIN